MTKDAIERKYLKFLDKIVGNHDEYSLMLHRLHEIEFYSFVPNDDNRGEDGKKLREMFYNESGANMALSLCPAGPCSVLEMLIGLSIRMYNELEGTTEVSVEECFWKLIDNLGLLWCNNYEYYPPGDGVEEISYIINNLLERKYKRDGKGGLFPLEHSNKDQRKIEIWYQMSEWLLENYIF